MARIVGGNPNGEFRGKLGGWVFSRNKSGQIARAYAMPVDPATIGQLNARNRFGQSVTAFHTLNPTQKADWNSFAAAYFTSKNRGNSPGLHSGINAFVSLRNILLNVADNVTGLGSMSLTVNGVAATALAQESIVLPNYAPNQPMQGVLDQGNYIISSASAGMSAGVITIEINVVPGGSGPGPGPTPPAPSTSSILTDGEGRKVGFAVYASNPLIQEGVFVQNPDTVLLGTTGLIDTYTTGSVITNQLVFLFDKTADQTEFRTAFTNGYDAQLGVWMFNDEGQTIRIGSNMAQIS